MKLPTAWFLPRDANVLALLSTQSRTVCDAITVLTQWAHHDLPLAQAVDRLRELLASEQGQRRALNAAVRASFSMPLEAEDLFELAERLHELATAAYTLVREAQLSCTEPDHGLMVIIDAVAAASRILHQALSRLPHADAAGISDRAADALTAAEHGYRLAIADLENEQDLRRELRRRELYRRAEHLTGATARSLHRIWYAVCKTS